MISCLVYVSYDGLQKVGNHWSMGSTSDVSLRCIPMYDRIHWRLIDVFSLILQRSFKNSWPGVGLSVDRKIENQLEPYRKGVLEP